MAFLRYYEACFVFVVFFNGVSFGVRDVSVLTEATSWSKWGSWSRCNALNYARETRFRSCLNWKGETQRSSNCVGHARRTRQCEGCQYPLLTQRSTTNPLYTISSSPAFHETADKKAWCATSTTGKEYLEINFKNFVHFTAIGTIGYNADIDNGYVSQYKLQYSYNGKDWFTFENNGEEHVFIGGDKLRKAESLPLVAQYLRVYPIKYETRACINVQLYGCEYNCGGLITQDLIDVKSPKAVTLVEEPNCLWRFEIAEAIKIQLLFNINLLCRDGSVQLVDGTSPFIEGYLFEEICGPTRTISPLSFRGNQLWLQYNSNATTDDIGFHLRANIYSTTTLNNSAGEVRTPAHKHEHKHTFRYTWIITAQPNMTIALTVHTFESNSIIQENGQCVGDVLVIHRTTDIENSLTERYCDKKILPKVFTSTTGYLRIKYRAGTDKPKWKLHFSYSVFKSNLNPTGSGLTDDSRFEREGIIRVPSVRPDNKSPTGNDTQLEIDAVQKAKTGGSESNVPVIISSILAVVIVLVLLVALLHFLRRRKEFLKKHPYDCSTRPMSHFGDEDSTPFINQNVLMWSDSNSRKNDKEKPKKNSLPHITVALRDDSPQRLSIIPAEMLTLSTDVPTEGELDEEKPVSLVVSDAFTEECLQLLGSNLNSELINNVDECETDAQTEPEEPTDENRRFSQVSTNSCQDNNMTSVASSLENFADCVSAAALQIARGIPLTSADIANYLRDDE